MIELRGVWKGFGSQQILEDISMQVDDGEKLCIIGQSGSGKSVTMKIMTGLLKADRGEVWVEGENVTHFQNRDWNRITPNFGVVFQGAALFDSLTVLENIGIRMFEDRKVDHKKIHALAAEALEQVGLDPEVNLGKFPSELSGGMQKRVGIARAIVHKPKVVFYDEPTTGLDPVNSGRIDGLMDLLSREPGRTSIIITHDMFTVKTIATKVAFIHNKRMHFWGTPEEMFASNDMEIRKFLARSIG
ncbi:MAG TPA: ATP-binding cassette domain-containing protein [Bacteroidetes bacterium]|nr:ATP-binding cassette domain-containing protein [Bacteroidota bacterium]